MAFVLLATTGMRRGEVLGLRWEDVDLDGRALSIVQTLTTVQRAHAHRSTEDRQESTPRLARHRDVRRAQGASQAPTRGADSPQATRGRTTGDLVFTDELGGPSIPIGFSKSFDRIVRDAELPRIRLHDLRHSYATLALKAGVHPKVVSERLGHSTIAITLDLYSHVAQGLDADAAELIASRIYGSEMTYQ